MNVRHTLENRPASAMTRSSGMQTSPGKLLALGAAITAGLMVLMQIPELKRYLRMRRM